MKANLTKLKITTQLLLLSSRHTTDGRNYRDNYSLLAIADTFEINQTVKISDENLNGNIVKLKTKSAEILAIADSGSSISFLNETTARRIHQNDKSTVKKIPPEDTARNLSCYNRKDIIPKGRLILAKEFGEWTIDRPHILWWTTKTQTFLVVIYSQTSEKN